MESKSTDRYNDNKNSIHVKGGEILLSSPLLNDPNFRRSVVLVLQQDGNSGHLGLVLNRRLDLTLEEICQMPGEGGRMNVFNGGPVDLQRLFWLHTLGDLLPGSLEVLPGLYVGGDYNALIEEFAKDHKLKGKIRFYLGYSGWSAGQLDAEAEAGAWGILHHILDPQLLIESDGDEMWHSLTSELGPDYRHWLILPSDPALN